MSTEKPSTSALAIMADRLGCDTGKLLETLKATVFKGASNEEMMALTIVSNQYGLNPFTGEIKAFSAKGGGIQPIITIDGWLRMVNEHPAFDGLETAYEMDGSKPVSCTCAIYRKDRNRPTTITEYFSECSRNTDPWKVSPMRMLRHKAIIQCARVAFGFSGQFDEDHPVVVPASQNIEDIKKADVVEVGNPALAPAKPSRLRAVVTPAPAPAPEPEPAPEPAPEPEPVTESVAEVKTPEEGESLYDAINLMLASHDISEEGFERFLLKRKMIRKGETWRQAGPGDLLAITKFGSREIYDIINS